MFVGENGKDGSGEGREGGETGGEEREYECELMFSRNDIRGMIFSEHRFHWVDWT